MFLIVSGFSISILFSVLIFFLNLERTVFNPDLILRIYHSDETRTERIIHSFSNDLAEKFYEFAESNGFGNDKDIKNLEFQDSFLKIFSHEWFNLQLQRNINGISKFIKGDSNEFQINISTYELVAPAIVEAKEISRGSIFFNDVVQSLLVQLFEVDESLKLNDGSGGDTPQTSFLTGEICKGWFAQNYENSVDLIGEYLDDTRNNLYIYWPFSGCADEIFRSVETSLTEKTHKTEFYTLLLEESLSGYFHQELWTNSTLEVFTIEKIKDLIIQSLIQSYDDDLIELEIQTIFRQMRPFFIDEDDDYLIDIVVLTDKEVFGNSLEQNFQNNFPNLNKQLSKVLLVEFLDAIIGTIPSNVQKTPSELSIILDQIGHSNNIQIVPMLRLLSADGFLIVNESEQNDELVYYLRFAKETVTTGYQYDLSEVLQNQNLWTETRLNRDIVNQVNSSKNGIIFVIFLLLVLDYYLLRKFKISSDNTINFLGFLVSILFFASLIYISVWNFILLDMFQYSKEFLESHLSSPIGFENTYQIFSKEMFGVVFAVFSEFHYRMLIQFVIGLVFLFTLVILRVILRTYGLSRIFRKRLH